MPDNTDLHEILDRHNAEESKRRCELCLAEDGQLYWGSHIQVVPCGKCHQLLCLNCHRNHRCRSEADVRNLKGWQ